MCDFGIAAFQPVKKAKANEWKNVNTIPPVEICIFCKGCILPLSLGPGGYMKTNSCSDITVINSVINSDELLRPASFAI